MRFKFVVLLAAMTIATFTFLGCSQDDNQAGAGGDTNKVLVPPGTPRGPGDMQSYVQQQQAKSATAAGTDYAEGKKGADVVIKTPAVKGATPKK